MVAVFNHAEFDNLSAVPPDISRTPALELDWKTVSKMRVCVIYLLLYAASVIPTFAQTVPSTPYAPARVQCRNNLQIRPASEVRTLFRVGNIEAKLGIGFSA